MLYRFKSQATAELTLLETAAVQILQAIGKTVAPQGAIQPEEMPAAIAALERAAKVQSKPDVNSEDAAEDTQADQPVSLAQRAAPFIQMLREAAAAGESVTWGV